MRAGFLLPVMLAGCSVFGDSYPMPTSPAGSSAGAPVEVGRQASLTVLFLSLRSGDEIELLSAEPVGVDLGADVQFFFSPEVHQPDGSVLTGSRLEQLAGATFTNTTDSDAESADNSFGVVAQITPRQPGRYRLEAVRLHYRLNGKEQVGEGISVTLTVCADDPAPASCDEPEASQDS